MADGAYAASRFRDGDNFEPAGDYELELTINPDGILPEANYDNNTVTIPVTIPVTIGGE